jgi:hypothetical protein
MPRCPTIKFQLSTMSKWLAKHISTKVFSKLLLGKDMFTLLYIEIQCETSISVWDIWNDDRTLMIDLLLFQLATRLNSQNTYETEILKEIWQINLIWILVIPIGIIEVTTKLKWIFWLYIRSLHNNRHPSTWKSLVYNSWDEM